MTCEEEGAINSSIQLKKEVRRFTTNWEKENQILKSDNQFLKLHTLAKQFFSYNIFLIFQ